MNKSCVTPVTEIPTGSHSSLLSEQMNDDDLNRNDQSNSSDSSDDSTMERTSGYALKATAELSFMPEDCLYHIFKFLGPVELHNISKLSHRLQLAAYDKRLWQKIDFRPHLLTSVKLCRFLKYFKSYTKYLALRGYVIRQSVTEWFGQSIVIPELFECIYYTCPELETLILEEHFGAAFDFKLNLFPRTLVYLSLSGCIITNINPERSYFHGLNVQFPKLKVLILTNCVWVTHFDLMSLCQCKFLEELRLDGCPQLGGCVVYTALATRYGFSSLKILDLRYTKMGDSDVTCFTRTRSLTHLYLECPPDDMYTVPKHQISEIRNGPPESSDEEPELQDKIFIASPPPPPPPLPVVRNPHLKRRKRKIRSCISCGNCADEDISQASTSHGIVSSVMPSTVKNIIQRKRRPQYSDSSSDENDDSEHDMQKSYKNTRMSIAQDSYRSKYQIKRKYNGSSFALSNEKEINNEDPKTKNTQEDSLSSSSTNSQKRYPDCIRPIIGRISYFDSSDDQSDMDVISGSALTVRDDMRVGQSRSANIYTLPSTDTGSESTITDITALTFSIRDDDAADGSGVEPYVRITSSEIINIRPELQTLVLRGYRGITDATLKHLVRLTSLRFLDISGTSITKEAILSFHLRRPEVVIQSDFQNLPL